ncbi:helix-turn-helix domain-containing protein [Streptomyces sp. SL13]|uniref:Helix-turn-helix domain-containing protein n=1 Tax=Streptantibioticus silvisoli TaxID=2705255 RepID=A0AA90H3J1_9ACTN|nr:TetR/AcrR family transcriptional regulator [Streptantibioticus silvisoli]MDI5962118.1 helix-turn-helix domain-containing protein [Streptantibioticus silvisoli]MDI5971331.1 helix-turn-helix domain-containing protein [Streptantibioticus silvisoli]
MHTQNAQWATPVRGEGVPDGDVSAGRAAASGTLGAAARGGQRVVVPLPEGRVTPLRVDAQRNLEHVLRAAREVFGELGYGAPMEDVARRARVGVGTVYRRFPSKDVLVRRIAEEETARLTEQARAALGQEEDPWAALSRFLRTSVASGAGRLLPPQVLRVRPEADRGELRVPQQREPAPQLNVAQGAAEGSGVATLLSVVGQLVERAREAGELRADVSVADVLLVIATAAPALPDPAQQAAASARLLEILLEGLRPRA